MTKWQNARVVKFELLLAVILGLGEGALATKPVEKPPGKILPRLAHENLLPEGRGNGE